MCHASLNVIFLDIWIFNCTYNMIQLARYFTLFFHCRNLEDRFDMDRNWHKWEPTCLNRVEVDGHYDRMDNKYHRVTTSTRLRQDRKLTIPLKERSQHLTLLRHGRIDTILAENTSKWHKSKSQTLLKTIRKSIPRTQTRPIDYILRKIR